MAFLKVKHVLVLLLIIGYSCDKAPEKEKTPNEDLNAWFEEKYEESLQKSPLKLTSLGIKDKYDQIDDLSLDAQIEDANWMQESVDELKKNFEYQSLNKQDQMSYDIWLYQNELLQEGLEYQDVGYVFDQMTGIHTQLPSMLINFHKVDSLEDMQAYVSRIQGTARAINQLVDRAKSQASKNILPPRFALETVLNQSKAIVTGQPFQDTEVNSPLYDDMLRKTDSLLTQNKIDDQQAKELRTASREMLLKVFQPAYNNLIAWTENEIPNALETPTGVSRHPNGKAFYDYTLKTSTTTSLTADEIHNIGLEEVDRIQKEMLNIKNEVGFEGDLQEFFKFVNEDEQFYFPNTDEGRQAYLDEAKQYIDELTKKLPDYFGILPKASLQVKRVEAFREQDGAPQHYNAGTPDGSRPGTYYVHLSDMTSMPKTTMEGVAYHEGNPGHHMQISVAQELETVPNFRTQLGYNAYVEGWALYSEKLAKEMGGYKNPYYDFGRLVNEIWRAIRLVVDTGLHSKGWKEAEAIQYFKDNSSISENAIIAEVQRYMVMPGQATGYKIGMLKIQELRQRAETQLGDRFDIRKFHDIILGSGALPLELLERQVDSWIEVTKQES
ncbi:hypothetical protein P700755_002226 [Psychroflexus torquis ATCC 700755]|uniref:DUF885 domain-containing protein n=1 Tax=Psychroflexus torquis (strain ATCC 700755 / CIP 106069 / ACAM 623) TaxID=313595 RepID=K4IU87_PSYTT|nr:DUF885 domain-containing protein [Psychroflexus torquis]AFU69015.1 hypothetical protein P700755_002226 [Psychroflexus torquis ATCC 700755]